MEQQTPPGAPEGRLASLDALRGFTMFWIIGGAEMLRWFLRLFANPLPPAIAHQFEHSAWVGMTAWDLVMPLFLFIAGTSLPFSLERRLNDAAGRRGVYRHLLKRSALLYLLGMIVGGNLLYFDPGRLYLFSNTLQAIACGCFVASLVVLHLNVHRQMLACAALLAAYALVLRFVPIPGHAPGALEPELNLARHVDRLLFGPYVDGSAYAWALCIPAFGASVLFGALAGQLLRTAWRPRVRLLVLAAAGLALVLLGILFGYWMPIIKHIWTSSFALYAAGWSFLVLAVFYAVIDVLGCRRWAFGFVVIGTNALFIYALTQFLGEYVTGDAREEFAAVPPLQGLALSVLAFAVFWTLLYGLYRKRIFIKL